MTACGYTPEEIGRMELHHIEALCDYWRDYPPAHEILAAAHGLKPRARAEEEDDPDDPSGIGGLIAAFPDGFVTAH